MSALTPAQAALRLLEHEHRPDPTQVSLRHTHRRYDHSVSTHLASPRRRFRTLPLSATSTRAGLGFVLPTRTRRVHPAVSSSSSYGLVIHLRLLPTSPRGDAVTVGYGPESACPGRTLTSLSVRACRRTWDAGHRPASGIGDRSTNTSRSPIECYLCLRCDRLSQPARRAGPPAARGVECPPGLLRALRPFVAFVLARSATVIQRRQRDSDSRPKRLTHLPRCSL
jgi:hypothetical protein